MEKKKKNRANRRFSHLNIEDLNRSETPAPQHHNMQTPIPWDGLNRGTHFTVQHIHAATFLFRGDSFLEVRSTYPLLQKHNSENKTQKQTKAIEEVARFVKKKKKSFVFLNDGGPDFFFFSA